MLQGLLREPARCLSCLWGEAPLSSTLSSAASPLPGLGSVLQVIPKLVAVAVPQDDGSQSGDPC